MTTLNTELYEALIEAGATKEKAKAAATTAKETATRKDVYLAMGFSMAIMGAGFGYVVSVLNTIIGKL